MTHEEIKQVLLLYRPGSADAGDREVAEALLLAKQDPELSQWLGEHCARQAAIRARLRQIPVPVRLKRGILSCHAARNRIIPLPTKIFLAAAMVMLLLSLAFLWARPAGDNNFGNYRRSMVDVAMLGYGMNLETNDLSQIQNYFAQEQAPADYTIPAGLQKVPVAGCATCGWKKTKVSIVCFRTGKPLPPNAKSDLWLFVVKKDEVKNLPDSDWPQFLHLSRLMTVSWTEGDKLYVLATATDRNRIKEYL